MGQGLIVGCGYVAGEADVKSNRRHIFTHANAIQRSKQLSVLCCVDKDINRARSFASTWMVPKHTVSLSSALKENNFDFAVVSTPVRSHIEVIDELLESSVKVIICEKPICYSLQELQSVLDRISKCGKTLFVNFMRRWCPLYQDIRQIVKDRHYGKLKTISCFVDTAVFTNSIHMIDLCIFFAGDYDSSCFFPDRTGIVRDVEGFKDIGGHFCIQHTSGVVSFVAAAGIPANHHQFEIILNFENGRIRVFNDDRELEFCSYRVCDEKPWLKMLDRDRYGDNWYPRTRLVKLYDEVAEVLTNKDHEVSYSMNDIVLTHSVVFEGMRCLDSNS